MLSVTEEDRNTALFQLPNHLEGRNFSVKTDSKSISLESKFQIPTNSTGPRMNGCSYYVMTQPAAAHCTSGQLNPHKPSH